MYRIAFFWVGGDISIPKCYVESIRMIYGDGIEILQLSDENTESISGVDAVIRKNLPASIMLARLEAYSQVRMDDRYTFFTDADSLLINRLNIKAGNDILLTPRILDFPINPNYPEYYEEFVGKMIGEVMPFLFGAIALKGNNEFFKTLLAICEKLPTRFHRWYGDQYALHKAIKNQLFSYDLLDPNIHLRITKTAPTIWELTQLRNDGVQLITFKGPDSNKSENMPIALKNLRQLVQ
ncbi:hypothetical protein [Polynucleobacter sp. es-MAR-4]|uniref:hypothetical protein n=1 Tax=Polynucleobacter sp. es-MAR-4 TaxID=1855655 RepID=UPI001C0E7F8A|nr:hypothetical protein [Polynucleobacter sp. es-MAR-4]MBU3637766.1 hypothetical protein [Polynucleobacter sp. es-MAR-4]